jgi:hypothetical protein
MSLVVPDFSEVAEAVTAGTYKTIIKKGEVKEWPNGGVYVNWELETVGDSEPKNNGRRIFHKTSIQGKGAFMLQQIYQNRSQEEMITQKTNIAKVQALHMAQQRNDLELKTAQLKKEKKDKTNQ